MHLFTCPAQLAQQDPRNSRASLRTPRKPWSPKEYQEALRNTIRSRNTKKYQERLQIVMKSKQIYRNTINTGPLHSKSLHRYEFTMSFLWVYYEFSIGSNTQGHLSTRSYSKNLRIELLHSTSMHRYEFTMSFWWVDHEFITGSNTRGLLSTRMNLNEFNRILMNVIEFE